MDSILSLNILKKPLKNKGFFDFEYPVIPIVVLSSVAMSKNVGLAKFLNDQVGVEVNSKAHAPSKQVIPGGKVGRNQLVVDLFEEVLPDFVPTITADKNFGFTKSEIDDLNQDISFTKLGGTSFDELIGKLGALIHKTWLPFTKRVSQLVEDDRYKKVFEIYLQNQDVFDRAMSNIKISGMRTGIRMFTLLSKLIPQIYISNLKHLISADVFLKYLKNLRPMLMELARTHSILFSNLNDFLEPGFSKVSHELLGEELDTNKWTVEQVKKLFGSSDYKKDFYNIDEASNELVIDKAKLSQSDGFIGLIDKTKSLFEAIPVDQQGEKDVVGCPGMFAKAPDSRTLIEVMHDQFLGAFQKFIYPYLDDIIQENFA